MKFLKFKTNSSKQDASKNPDEKKDTNPNLQPAALNSAAQSGPVEVPKKKSGNKNRLNLIFQGWLGGLFKSKPKNTEELSTSDSASSTPNSKDSATKKSSITSKIGQFAKQVFQDIKDLNHSDEEGLDNLNNIIFRQEKE
jgi:hypothetical protein